MIQDSSIKKLSFSAHVRQAETAAKLAVGVTSWMVVRGIQVRNYTITARMEKFSKSYNEFNI